MKKQIVLTALSLLSAAFLAGCASVTSASANGTASTNKTTSASSGVVAVTSGSKTLSGTTISSTASDEDAVLVNGSGAKALLTDCTITKSGDTSSADNSSFYGQNATCLAKNGSLYVKGGTINSTAEGGAGVAAYSSSGYAYANAVSIHTTANAAGGLHACGGGTVYGLDNTITTEGQHSAAIRSDRGGGTMEISGGTYTSSGAGSPAIYCTADIEVKGATLTATGSEAFAMEGMNKTSLFDCSLSGSMPSSTENNGIQWNVIVYQSMSGDSATGTGTFSMVGGSLIANKGGMFMATNTSAQFYLKGVSVTPSSDNPFLLRATKVSRWSGDSSPSCHFTAEDETLTGKIIYDSYTSVQVDLLGSTVWTGSFAPDTTYTGSKTTSLAIASGASWTVNAASTISGDVYNAGTINDATITAKNGTFGNGTYAVTVAGNYLTSDNTSSSLSAPTWTDLPAFPSAI